MVGDIVRVGWRLTEPDTDMAILQDQTEQQPQPVGRIGDVDISAIVQIGEVALDDLPRAGISVGERQPRQFRKL